ncbi:MAG: YeeE/YedE family protein [Anaerolineae bacterium]|nr:YeeE/YedE family protein [Anaerolineae bacterium]
MNSGFRNLLVRRDTTRFKAYLLAIAVQMLMLPILQFLGIVKFTVPAFYPLGATLGGFLFGLAMNWGGGCAGGVWYKLGGGSIGAFVAIIGLILGYATTESGALKPLRMFMQSIGSDGGVETMTIASLFNLPLWWMSVPFAVVLLFFLLKNSPTNPEKGWNWRKTGLWVGAIGAIAWVASSLSGRFFGMAVLPGSKDVIDLMTIGNRSALSWDFFFVLGIPIGGFLSTTRHGAFSWSNISGASIWKLAGGGFILGASASLAGGCTVGHGLAGIPILSIGSIAFTLFAILGVWAGVALKRKT